MARVVLACALKHHTRRGERDPERWQRAQPAFHRLGPLPALDPLGGHRHDRRHRRHLGLAARGDPGGVLGRASRDRNRASARARHPPAGRRRRCYQRRSFFVRPSVPTASLDDRFRNTVLAHLVRTGLSGRRLGQKALRDPGFVASLKRGRRAWLPIVGRRVCAFSATSPSASGRRSIATDAAPHMRRKAHSTVPTTWASAARHS